MPRTWLSLIVSFLALHPPLSHADAPTGPTPATFAVIVGSNPGGPGQQALRYAEQDAQNMAGLLVELGRTTSDNIQLLLQPSSDELRAALNDTEVALNTAKLAGKQTRLIFYYSGHARSQALNLGAAELPLSELRAALKALPANFTLVVLDACQSGAISNIKGAEPRSDFTHNTLASLSTVGLAVMASSSGSELSQESDTLGGGYFTHHLATALRGAGDEDRDARVSLDEAYRYAYRHTLASTAKTAVGGQHVTLETDLRGKGDVPLSYTSDAKAQLELPASLEGEILIQQANAGSVMAELHKARGHTLTLALPPGAYDANLRNQNGDIYQCPVLLTGDSSVILQAGDCNEVHPEKSRRKGPIDHLRHERFFVEVGPSASLAINDRYLRRLEDFGYETDVEPTLNFLVRLGYLATENFGVQLEYRSLESRVHHGNLSLPDEFDSRELNHEAHAVLGGLRARLPLFNERIALSALAGAGVGIGFTELNNQDRTETGLATQLAAHFDLNLGPMGVFVEAGIVHAPIHENLLNNRHNSGGPYLALGLHARERIVR